MPRDPAKIGPPITASAREKQRVRRLVSRIYGLLNSGEWRLRYAAIRGNLRLAQKWGVRPASIGFCDYEAEIIYVDHREDVIMTIIHECLHALYPDKAEAEILALEKLIGRHLSSVQARRLHLLSACALDP